MLCGKTQWKRDLVRAEPVGTSNVQSMVPEKAPDEWKQTIMRNKNGLRDK